MISYIKGETFIFVMVITVNVKWRYIARRKLRAKELMLLNCGVGEDS